MPHPERHVRFTQHPQWSRLERTEDRGQKTEDRRHGDGMAMFANAVKFIKENF
jgi:phosphoribosylformylglycinamidine (FGAM) synthase-like amidotransferase family enzyme